MHQPSGEQTDGEVDNIGVQRVYTRAQVQARTHTDVVTVQTQHVAPPSATGRRKDPPKLTITELWSLAHIRDEQSKDETISKIIPFILSGEEPVDLYKSHDRELQCLIKQRQSLVVKDGILYRAFSCANGKISHYQLVVPKSMRESLIEHIHAVIFCHLKAQWKMEHELARHAFFPMWKQCIRIFLAKCRVCSSYHTGKIPRNAYLRPPDDSLSEPGVRLSIDLVGPWPTSHGYRYAITMCDMFSRFVHIQPLKNKSALEVATALLKFFLTFGWYSITKNDLGTEFENEVSYQLYQLTGIQRHVSFSYMPRQNLIERSHRVINSMIGKTVNAHRNWTEFIDSIAFAYNCSVHKATGFTPNYLHFGRELYNSLDLLMANPRVEVQQNFGEFAESTAEKMQFAFTLARQHGLQQAESAKRYYDARVTRKILQVGDVVLAYCPQRKRNVFTKWARPFSAEAVVTKVINDSTYAIQFVKTGKSRIFHIDKLRLLHHATPQSGGERSGVCN